MGGGSVVDKVVSVGSGRRPGVGLNPTTYRFEAMPFVEWFRPLSHQGGTSHVASNVDVWHMLISFQETRQICASACDNTACERDT
ncbi:hypothetical protein E2C01_100751 [Portunus trituberculatus]|uniref:Uncharacterized protein n=1 Tax=Portunus trituberculatus TaxID=210409 RepID=A0A5B7K7Q4_PORTR|nr:hypothetical protein [Portunus trituberculatus]